MAQITKKLFGTISNNEKELAFSRTSERIYPNWANVHCFSKGEIELKRLIKIEIIALLQEKSHTFIIILVHADGYKS